MSTSNTAYLPLPDPGAVVVVHLRNGTKFSGAISDGHVWVDSAHTVCLTTDERGRPYISPDDASCVWTYISRAEIVAYTWDCAN